MNRFSKYLLDIYVIDLSKDFPYWNKLKEAYYRRNMYVHAKRKVNSSYIREVASCSTKEKGKKLPITLSYISNCVNTIIAFFYFLLKHIALYFNLDTINQTLSSINNERKYGIKVLKLVEPKAMF